jgi:hypothetical protein
MNRLRKKNIANIAAGSSAIAMKLAARVRLAKIRKGRSGCSTRDSTATNSASRTPPATRLVIVHGSLQPYVGFPAWVRP